MAIAKTRQVKVSIDVYVEVTEREDGTISQEMVQGAANPVLEALRAAELDYDDWTTELLPDGFGIEMSADWPAPPEVRLVRVGTVNRDGSNWRPLMQPPMPLRHAHALVEDLLAQAARHNIRVSYDIRDA